MAFEAKGQLVGWGCQQAGRAAGPEHRPKWKPELFQQARLFGLALGALPRTSTSHWPEDLVF